MPGVVEALNSKPKSDVIFDVTSFEIDSNTVVPRT